MFESEIDTYIATLPWWLRRRARVVRSRIRAIHQNNWHVTALISGRHYTDLMYQAKIEAGYLVLVRSFLTADDINSYFRHRYGC